MEECTVYYSEGRNPKETVKSFLKALEDQTVKTDISSLKIFTYGELLDSSSTKNAMLRTNSSVSARSSVWLNRAQKNAYRSYFESPPQDFSISNFKKTDIRKIANLSAVDTKLYNVKSTLLDYGILLNLEPHIVGNRIDGSVFKLENGTPCITLSNRFQRVDFAWFTLLHELAHIALHFDSLDTPIIDDMSNLESNIKEKQANMAAREAIAPRDFWRSCSSKSNENAKVLLSEAESIEVAPQLLAGLIRFEKNNYSLYSSIINTDINDIIYENM
jgi:HTH-type transcriptional regulator/antitoxin HigA